MWRRLVIQDKWDQHVHTDKGDTLWSRGKRRARALHLHCGFHGYWDAAVLMSGGDVGRPGREEVRGRRLEADTGERRLEAGGRHGREEVRGRRLEAGGWRPTQERGGRRLEADTGERRSGVQHEGDVWDSLEGSAGSGFEARGSMPFPTGGPEAGRGMGGAEAPGELPSDDAYSDLHYDPDWRSKLKASERFSDSPRPQEEHLPDSTGRSRGDYCMGEELVIKGGYRYIVAASPSFPPGPPSNMAQDEAREPYHLHPQHRVAGNSGYPDHQTTQTRSNALLLPEANQTLGKEDTAVQRESSHGDTGENHKVPAQPQPSQNVQEVAAGKRSKNTSKLKSPLLAYRNLERTREDIVERNKITLGRNTAKCGSYLKAHAPKQETDNMMKTSESNL
ncbi:hypothetical protein N1851_027259 [Merluccius polli]|uniref:Uncharacterized protein n=1 Tax=Merluccius polli TaxID=89951 RepID=A0AA47MAP0_MERPO|nr:hypothetical protein N1851_027259 [Merluccius polli]